MISDHDCATQQDTNLLVISGPIEIFLFDQSDIKSPVFFFDGFEVVTRFEEANNN